MKSKTHKKEHSFAYDEELDILKIGPRYVLGELTHITVDKKNHRRY